MEIKITIDIIKYTLYFLWALVFFCMLAFLFIWWYWDILFPDYDQMPGSVFKEEDS